MSRSSPCSDADRVGSGLVALALGVVAGTLIGHVTLPPRAWAVPLAAAAVLAALAAARRHREAVLIWAACGSALALFACTLAPRAPAPGARLPVRFEAVVRDGWVPDMRGYRTRIRLIRLTLADRELRHPAEATLVVGGEHVPEGLPAPGRRVSGSGEAAWPEAGGLRRPTLRVKSVLLLDSAPARGVDALREAAVSRLRLVAGEDGKRAAAAGLVAALTLGRREHLSPDEVLNLRRSGLAHLLAVSGMHVGIVATLAWGLLALTGLAPPARRWALAAVIIAFALLAGGNQPVLRASAGATAFLVARQLGRGLAPLPAVWGVVAGLLLVEPAALLSVSFQLSAGITLALVRFVKPLRDRLHAVPGWMASALAVVVVAQLASMPLVGIRFGTLPPLGMAANLVAAPLAFVMVGLALLALVLAPVWTAAAAVILSAVALCERLLDLLASTAGALVVPFPDPPAWLVIILLGLGLLAVLPGRRAPLFAAAGLVIVVGWLILPGARPSGFEATMLPVREGMAMLIRGPAGTTLVDCGRYSDEAARELARRRVRRIDALVLTHGDEDHVGGAAAILERLRVATVVLPLAATREPELEPLRALARDRGAAELAVRPGDVVGVGAGRIEVLWPDPEARGLSGNDASLVALMHLGSVRLLITGDLEAIGERRLLQRSKGVRAELLQLGHHGSRTSSTARFLAAVHPAVVLAPTGTRPRVRYPHAEVRTRVRALPAVVVEPSFGSVTWSADGSVVRVLTPKPVTVAIAGRR